MVRCVKVRCGRVGLGMGTNGTIDWQHELSKWDDGFEVRTGISRVSVIPNGLFTLKQPDGTHRTFRIHTRGGRGQLAGKRIISLLIGPDNEREYQPFGFVNDTGISVWKRCAGSVKFAEYAARVWRLATGGTMSGYELMVSKRCLKCNRPLTTPASIERGIGDRCAKSLASR